MTDIPVLDGAFEAGRAASPAQTASVRDYLTLMKPRVMSLVVFTAFVGMVLAPGSLDPVLAVISLFAITVGGGASAALNMWYDADIDARMSRTVLRPVPQGRISPADALGFGGALSLFSVMVLGLASNYVAAALLAFTIAFYVLIYTVWLKRRTPQNIVIGGAAGALPPLVGWAAVSGGISLEPVILFAIVFLWTPPHFWALALYREGDYARAGVPMMPNVAGAKSTCRQIALYAVLLFAASMAPLFLGMTGLVYGAAAIPAGLTFIVLSVRLAAAERRGERPLMEKRAKGLFGYSLFYLALLFVALLAERWIMGSA